MGQLKTCRQCRKREYCENCAGQEGCWWREHGHDGFRALACGSFDCKYMDKCKAIEPDNRAVAEPFAQLRVRD